MIKASVMNFVRNQASIGSDFVELQNQLKELSKIDIDGEKKKLASVQEDRARAEKGLKDAQESAAHTQMVADQHLAEAARLKKEAEDIVLGANRRGQEMILEAKKAHDSQVADWDKAIESKRTALNALDRDYGEALHDLDAKRKEHAELEKQHEELIRKHSTLVGALAAMKSSL